MLERFSLATPLHFPPPIFRASRFARRRWCVSRATSETTRSGFSSTKRREILSHSCTTAEPHSSETRVESINTDRSPTRRLKRFSPVNHPPHHHRPHLRTKN